MSHYIPKIRIRTPKWQAIRSASWAKELLMTFVGATLSIILTFGTAHFVDQKQQREDGRQTAMMVIHDIENTAKRFREYVKEEERNFNAAQRVLTDVDHLNAISSDTVMSFVAYIASEAGQLYNYDNSSEQIFLSSQDAWKTIDNPAFVDEVQAFFHARQQIYDMLNNDRLFAKPVTGEELYALMLESPEIISMDTAFWVNHAKTFVHDKRVSRFVEFSFIRRRYYNEYADKFMSVANKCKFMMGITDEELAQYVHNKSRSGKPLTEKKLIDNWRVQTADDLYSEREFCKDHTYTTQITQYMSYSFYTGQIALTCILHGTWELQGDSLYLTQHPDYSYEFDRSAIRYQPEMASSVDNLIEMWEQSVILQLNALTKNEGEPRKSSVFASIDATGNKIELRSDEEGIIYLIRCGKP